MQVDDRTLLSSANALELFAPYDVILDGTDAVSRERRVRDQREAQCVWKHLPIRGAGVGLRDQGWSLLPVPLSRAATSGPRAKLRQRGLGVLPGIIGVIPKAVKLDPRNR